MLTRPALRTLGLVLALSIPALPAVAQDPGTDQTKVVSAPTKTDEIDSLLIKIKSVDNQLVQLLEDVSAADGEQRILLRDKIDDLARQQKNDLSLLRSLITEREAAGADVTLYLQEADQLTRRASRRVRAYIQNLQQGLAEAAAQRPTLAPGDLHVFELQMADGTSRLDSYYTGMIDLTDEMTKAGLSHDDETAFLEERLPARGERLLRLLEVTKKQLEEYRDLLKKAPGDSDLQTRVFAMEERYHSNKTSLLATIHMLERLGLENTELEVQTLEITGEITPESLEVDVATGLIKSWWQRSRSYLRTNGARILVQVTVVIATLLAFWILARLVRWFTGKALDKTRIAMSELLRDMVLAMVGRVVMVIGFIVVLGQFGINLGPILAGFGVAGIVIGFALQDTLSNFAAGAMILAYQPYDVGDFVEAAGVSGRVRDMNLVSTRILTIDHQTLIVPNSKIWGNVIRNVTAQPRRRVDMVFGISYEDEIPKAERVLTEIVLAHDKVLDDPEPIIKVHTLNESSVDFIVRPWAETPDYWDVYWDITREVKLRFDQEDITIPFPQRDVHIKGQEPAASTAT